MVFKGVVDLNGNHLSSILFLNTSTNQYVSWEMNDTTVAAVHTLGAPGAGWNFLGLS